MAKKYVYSFKKGKASMKNLLGGKGANLAEMTRLGLPVPPGFVISTEACTRYWDDKEKIGSDIVAQIDTHLLALEKMTGKKFGDKSNPLFVSVRSGSRASMPGMMDTILNLGMNDETVEGFAALTGSAKFAYECYIRLVQMLGEVVHGIAKKDFDAFIEKRKEVKKVKNNNELPLEELKKVVTEFKAIYKRNTKSEFPQNVREQLMMAIEAVFRSWNNSRAVAYRRLNDIPESWGTAVNIQSMVFGNMGETSGTGVAFTRNPTTGERKIFGEYLMNAQGEDVVNGSRTPLPIDTLAQDNPAIYSEFVKIANKLERHFKDMQDMEFTIENGKFYILQTRAGKRTAPAALRIAIELVKEKLLTEKEALLKIDPKQLDSLLHPQFDKVALGKAKPIAKGLPASPGAACGIIALSAENAMEMAAKGKKVVLVRQETSAEDIEGMMVSQGILTARGGMTSHAAVVARGMGVCCVAGCSEVTLSRTGNTCTIGEKTFNEGDEISIDGTAGNVYTGAIATVEAEICGDFDIIMSWADKYKYLQIRTNADNAKDSNIALKFGAQGIGLTRTEHMFFDAKRILAMREMILSPKLEDRVKALQKLQPFQRGDFVEIFEAMGERPVTIRLLDPPLHEFLPSKEGDIKELAKELKMAPEKVKAAISGLAEFNPMLGHRGCRLLITYPEIAAMQTRAIIGAAIEVFKKDGIKANVEIEIPLVCDVKEFRFLRDVIIKSAEAEQAAANVRVNYHIGTMIETPRATLLAGEIAKEAKFFSFGTNDLTQMTYGFSRDDAGKFLADYYEKKIFEQDPFARLDQNGVGKLIETAVRTARQVRPGIEIGICGEHGGDPSSIEFCHNAGLTNVSCSPFRVPVARLAAAQANIKNPRK